GDNQGRLFFAVHTAVLVAVVPAFFGGQAFNEVEVGFPVLYAVLPFLRGALEVKHGVDDAPLFQQVAYDGVGALGLEDTAVVHQAQAPHRRLDHQFIVGAAVAGVASGKLVHDTGKTALGLTVLPHHQVHRLLQNVGWLNVWIGAGQFQAAVRQRRQTVGEHETDTNKVNGGEFAYTGGELQSACLGHVFDP